MDAQELLTAPASTLTRKQRKERAALKRHLEKTIKVRPGYMLGRTRVVEPLRTRVVQPLPDDPRLPGTAIRMNDLPRPIASTPAFGQHVVVSLPGTDHVLP